MAATNEKKANYVDKNDIWFTGQKDVLEDGNATFFVCQFYDDYHYDEQTSAFVKYCKKDDRVFTDEVLCSMKCDQYGRCETCRGFSAIRCQNCYVPRP